MPCLCGVLAAVRLRRIIPPNKKSYQMDPGNYREALREVCAHALVHVLVCTFVPVFVLVESLNMQTYQLLTFKYCIL